MKNYLRSLALTLKGYSPQRKWALERGIEISETESTTIFTRKDEVIILSKRHAAYYDDIIDFFDYYFSSVKFVPLGESKVVDYSKTNFHVLSKSNVGFYFTSFPESDLSTDIYLDKFDLKKGDVVFDLGAYCGATAYFFSKAVSDTGKVVSIEADPKNFEVFNKNIQYHKLENVIGLNNYIWHKKDAINFNSEGNMGSTAVDLLGRNDNTVTINSVTLDDMLSFSDGRVDAIKIDIEGAELELISKSASFFSNHRPQLIIEPHEINGKVNTEDLVSSLKNYGYHCELMQQDELHLPLIYAH